MGAQKRIIGGNTASFGELPWQAHIRISGFQCGGVLLNHYYVATAGLKTLRLPALFKVVSLHLFTFLLYNFCKFSHTLQFL